MLNNSWKEERAYILAKAREEHLIPTKASAEEAQAAAEELLKEVEEATSIAEPEPHSSQ